MDSDQSKKLVQVLYRFTQLQRRQSQQTKMLNSELHLLSALDSILKERERNHNSDGVMVSELLERVETSFSAVSRSLKGLEEKGYIDRIPSKTDRRVVRLSLTESGYTALKCEHEKMMAGVKRLVEHLGVERTEQFAETLESMYQFIKQELEAEELHAKDC